jgi:hypothetical protein
MAHGHVTVYREIAGQSGTGSSLPPGSLTRPSALPLGCPSRHERYGVERSAPFCRPAVVSAEDESPCHWKCCRRRARRGHSPSGRACSRRTPKEGLERGVKIALPMDVRRRASSGLRGCRRAAAAGRHPRPSYWATRFGRCNTELFRPAPRVLGRFDPVRPGARPRHDAKMKPSSIHRRRRRAASWAARPISWIGHSLRMSSTAGSRYRRNPAQSAGASPSRLASVSDAPSGASKTSRRAHSSYARSERNGKSERGPVWWLEKAGNSLPRYRSEKCLDGLSRR